MHARAHLHTEIPHNAKYDQAHPFKSPSSLNVELLVETEKNQDEKIRENEIKISKCPLLIISHYERMWLGHLQSEGVFG